MRWIFTPGKAKFPRGYVMWKYLKIKLMEKAKKLFILTKQEKPAGFAKME